jgi:hypothetical protein
MIAKKNSFYKIVCVIVCHYLKRFLKVSIYCCAVFYVLLSLRDFSYFTGSSEISEKFRLGADFLSVYTQKLAKISDVFRSSKKNYVVAGEIPDSFCLLSCVLVI